MSNKCATWYCVCLLTRCVYMASARQTPLASADEVLGRLYAFTETRAIANAGEAAKAHELIALSASQGLAAVVNKLPEGLPPHTTHTHDAQHATRDMRHTTDMLFSLAGPQIHPS